MTEAEPQIPVQYLTVGTGSNERRIAYINERAVTHPEALSSGRAANEATGVLWMQGFKSDMISTKASALSTWTQAQNIPYIRLDYSGHGQSGGDFEAGTIGLWLEEAVAVFSKLTTGPQVVVGSSMGGYLSLLLLRWLLENNPAEAQRIKALVLIAPAWDMTEELMWLQFPDDVKRQIEENGVWLRPSEYGDPYPITRGLIEDGRHHLIGRSPWDPGRPVRIIQGRLDPDVPFMHAERLMKILTGGDQRLIEVTDGEHRLSRPQDLALLLQTIGEVL